MALFRKNKNRKEKPTKFMEFPYLLPFKPKEKIVFHSDYFEIDDKVATIMSFFHIEGSYDGFYPFWGINRVPSGLSKEIVEEDGSRRHVEISIVSFEQISKMSESWLRTHQTKAENLADKSDVEQKRGGSNTSKGRAGRIKEDLVTIAKELQNGASYLNVHYRLLVKAPTLEDLDNAIEDIERFYIDRFATLSAAPYHGIQRNELTNLFRKNVRKEGNGFHFTSTELAGSYALVTHGLEDPKGEYVGTMVGDVNNSAVLFDVNRYRKHVVVANENIQRNLNRAKKTNMWGSKMGQAALLDNNRVVHLVLDGAKLDELGPSFSDFTHKVDMNSGDVNMFEMFGSEDNELAVFSTQMQKLILMTEQAYETTDSDRSIIRNELESVATSFYIQSRMWYHNAKENRDRLRVVGIPHREVPTLRDFLNYVEAEYDGIRKDPAKDPERLHAYSILRGVFQNLLSNNGDLFDTHTTDVIDNVIDGKRVVYDFSSLMDRGRGIAMAQLINIVGFALGNLSAGDLVIIHGADLIDDSVKDYIRLQLDRLFDKGGRVAYLYNYIDKMLADNDFCEYDKADYVIFGNMTPADVDVYQKAIGQKIPEDLAGLITKKSSTISYIRRGFDNVVFTDDLLLGVKGDKKRGKI